MAYGSYAQRKAEVRKAVSAAKVQLNQLNGQLEKTRREASRLLDRKTLITPDSLVKLNNYWQATITESNDASSAIGRLSIIASAAL